MIDFTYNDPYAYIFFTILQKKICMANLPSNIFERMNKLFFNQYTYISLSQI